MSAKAPSGNFNESLLSCSSFSRDTLSFRLFKSTDSVIYVLVETYLTSVGPVTTSKAWTCSNLLITEEIGGLSLGSLTSIKFKKSIRYTLLSNKAYFSLGTSSSPSAHSRYKSSSLNSSFPVSNS